MAPAHPAHVAVETFAVRAPQGSVGKYHRAVDMTASTWERYCAVVPGLSDGSTVAGVALDLRPLERHPGWVAPHQGRARSVQQQGSLGLSLPRVLPAS